MNRSARIPPTPIDRDVRFQLRKDPGSRQTPALSYPWINTNAQIQIYHLKRFVSRKLAVQGKICEADDIRIWISIRMTKIVCSDLSRFSDIQAVWPSSRNVELFYTCDPPSHFSKPPMLASPVQGLLR